MPTLDAIKRGLLTYGPSVGANIVGGIVNRRAAGSATNRLTSGVDAATQTITEGAERSRKTLADVYGEQKGLLTPYREAGAPALESIKTGTAAGGEFNKPYSLADFDLYKDPGFNFRIQQGERAIQAGANAGGIRFSGATLKALSNYNQEAASQEAANAHGRFQSDLTGRFNRLQDASGIGERATQDAVRAGSEYGNNLVDLDQSTAQSLADLETSRASAEAAGDVAKANTINDTISGILGTISDIGTQKALEKILGVGAKVGGAAGSLAAATAAAPFTGSLAAIGTPALSAQMAGLSSIASAGSAAVGGTSAAAAGGGTAAGGGLGGTLGLGGGSGILGLGAATIPIFGAAAVGVGLLWRKSQAHHEANEWGKEFQRPFDAHMADIDNRLASGQVDEETAAALKKEAAIDYIASALNFAKKGSDQRKVVGQSMATFNRWYGDPRQLGYTGPLIGQG